MERVLGDRHTMCILVYDQLCTFEFATASELLGDRSEHFGDRWYSLTIAATESAPVRGAGGVLVDAGGADLLQVADTIVVPGWRMDTVPASLSEALGAAHKRGARIASICTGAFVLAAAGLLDHRRATTHWRFADQLAAEFPAVEVDPDVLYIDHGDVITSAGSVAGIDMLLHLVRKDFGSRTCNAVARSMVTAAQRDGGQAQFFERILPQRADGAFALIVNQMHQQPTREYRIEHLADLAAMSTRTFFRRFREATGWTPHEWLLRARLNIAKELLEETASSIDAISELAGFGSADSFRLHFRRIVGTTPSNFRDAFVTGSPKTGPREARKFQL